MKSPKTLKPGNSGHFPATLLVFGIVGLLAIIIAAQEDKPVRIGMTGAEIHYETGIVLSVSDEKLESSTYENTLIVGTQQLTVRILSGAQRGRTASFTHFLSPSSSIIAEKGQRLVLAVDVLDNGKMGVRVYSLYREPLLYLMAVLFFLALALVGGKKGILSGIGLLYTFFCILLVFLPLVTRGVSPILASLLLVLLVTGGCFILLTGFTRKSLCCLIGTTGGVLLSGLIQAGFSHWVKVSGYQAEEAESLLLISQTNGLKIRELLFAAIIIASLGAVMDTAISIVSAMHELHHHNPFLTSGDLFKSGMNIGKDTIGTMSNTLILAFTGTMLNLMLLLHAASIEYMQLIHMDTIVIEVVQALSGAIGIVLTVPLTAFVTVRLLKPKRKSLHSTPVHSYEIGA